MSTNSTSQALTDPATRDVSQPKLDGHRVALRGRVFPDQHRRAHLAAAARGMSLSQYLGVLIDADAGIAELTPTPAQEELPLKSA